MRKIRTKSRVGDDGLRSKIDCEKSLIAAGAQSLLEEGVERMRVTYFP